MLLGRFRGNITWEFGGHDGRVNCGNRRAEVFRADAGLWLLAFHSALRNPQSAIRNAFPRSRFPAVGRRLPFWQFPRPWPLVPPCLRASVPPSRSYSSAFYILDSAFCTPHCPLRTRNSFARLGLQKQRTQGDCNSLSRLNLRPQVSPGFRLPVFRPPFPAFGSYPQRRMPMRPCKNHQIRVKIGQKGDVFRQKGIKKARISSCPS
jgi:hypothetical protein